MLILMYFFIEDLPVENIGLANIYRYMASGILFSLQYQICHSLTMKTNRLTVT